MATTVLKTLVSYLQYFNRSPSYSILGHSISYVLPAPPTEGVGILGEGWGGGGGLEGN